MLSKQLFVASSMPRHWTQHAVCLVSYLQGSDKAFTESIWPSVVLLFATLTQLWSLIVYCWKIFYFSEIRLKDCSDSVQVSIQYGGALLSRTKIANSI